MSDLKTVIANNSQAVTDFLTTAGALAPSEWGRHRAPGKWSPGQVAEHLVLTYELGGASCTEPFLDPPHREWCAHSFAFCS